MANAIANLSPRINGETISIVPNSFVIIQGLGEINVRAASSGGNSIESVHTVNAESKIGKFSFDVYNTPTVIRSLSSWKANQGGNEITGLENLPEVDSISLTLKTASLCNDPEQPMSADGVTSLEFKGDPAIIG